MADLNYTNAARPKIPRNKYGYINGTGIVSYSPGYSGGGSYGGDSGSGGDGYYSDFIGANSSTDGKHGLVPAPGAGQQNCVLHGSGEWQSLFGDTITYDSSTNTLTVDASLVGKIGKFEYLNVDDASFGTLDSLVINASTGNFDSVYADIVDSDLIKAVDSSLTNVESENITTKNLTVTGSAHFFELLIDKIKAVGGQVILTAASAKIDVVKEYADYFECFWRSTDPDTGEAIDNEFEVNDQIICQTFNRKTLPEGETSYNVSNKYYWTLCTYVGGTTIDGELYNGVRLSKTVCVGTLNPEPGDEIVQLGSRGTDTNRRNAIILASYQSVDTGVKSPSIVQYKGINTFELAPYRYNVMAANGNEFRGTFKVTSGDNIEDLIESIGQGTTAYLHTAWANSADGSLDFTKVNTSHDYKYIGLVSNFTQSDAGLTYSDYTWTKLKGDPGGQGDPGADAEFYRLIPVTESAEVSKTGVLGVVLKYQIVHVVGSDSEIITASSNGYKVRFSPSNRISYTILSYSNSPAYTNTSYMANYHTATNRPAYFTVSLIDSSSNVVDQRLVTVVFNAAATLTITDSIQATVSSHTTSINDLTGKVESNTQNISSITQKADSIESSVSSITSTLDKTSEPRRNLIVGSYIRRVTKKYGGRALTANIVEGKTYTFSFNGYCTQELIDKGWWLQGMAFDENQQIQSISIPIKTTTATTVSKTFTAAYTGKINIDFYPYKNVLTTYEQRNNKAFAVINWCQLEEGETATPWTLAEGDPEVRENLVTDDISEIMGDINDSATQTIELISNGCELQDGTILDCVHAKYTGTNYFDAVKLDNGVSIESIQSYTLSLYAKGSGQIKSYLYPYAVMGWIGPDGTIYKNMTSADSSSDGQTIINLTNEWTKYVITWTALNSGDSNIKNLIVGRLVADTEAYIAGVKFEKGGYASIYDQTKSLIKQTADSILMQVNDISIKLNNGIQLNGDTVVNGSVTINDEDTGFLLKGNTGTTQITANSIGNYYNFYNLSNKVITSQGTYTSYGGLNAGNGTYDFRWIFTRSFGNVPSDKTVTFNTSTINFMKLNSGTVLSGSGISYTLTIYEGSTQKYTNTFTSTNSMTLGTSYVSSGGEVKVTFDIKASFDRSYWSDNKQSEVAGANCNWSIKWQYPNDNFQMIGYDGHGINFGNGCVDYFGPLMTVIKYGDYGIRVSNDGVERYVTSNLSSSKRSHLHGSTTYTDTLSTIYKSEWCPLNGYAIRYTATADGGNIYIDKMDDVIEVKNTSGIVNIFLGAPSYFTGKRILIKKIAEGGDMDVYAGYSTSQTLYKIIKANVTTTDNSRTDSEGSCRAYFSDGTYWIEEWLGW